MADEDDWGAQIEECEKNIEEKLKVKDEEEKVNDEKKASEVTNQATNGHQAKTNGATEEEWEDEKEPPPEEQSLINKHLHSRVIQSKHEVEVVQKNPNSPLYSVKAFAELHLHPDLLTGITKMGFNKPSKIQETALPMLLADPPSNMIAQSQSGTGKTAAFLLTMLTRVDAAFPFPQALCLSPTFELARQTGQVLETLGADLIKSSGLKIKYAIRGESVPKGHKLQEHILIGTPGTVLHWILRHKCFDPQKLKVFVFDEADVMISQQGHLDQSLRIKNMLGDRCQLLLFSATYEAAVMEFAQKAVKDPVIIRLRREEESLENIIQRYVKCGGKGEQAISDAKYSVLANMYGSLTIGQCMVFCHTRNAVQALSEKMAKDGHAVAILSGALEIEQRISVLDRFRKGKEKLLICTNVAARGIDIESLTMVVNYDIPVDMFKAPDFDTYLHRIGRTGRFGKKGYAINLVADNKDERMVKQIEEHFQREIKILDTEDLEQLKLLEAGE